MSLVTVLKAIKSNKIKTSLIYLSLVVTIISIFLITSISHGIISMYSNMLKSDGDIIVTQAKISDTFFSNVNKNLIPKISAIKDVKQVSALIVGASPVDKLPIVAIYGASKNMFDRYKLLQGNYPQENQVIIGNSIYEQLSNKNEINIANKTFVISGVFSSDIGFENGGVVMNLDDAGEIFNKSASMLLIDTDLSKDIQPIISKIKALSQNIDAKSTQNFVDNYNQFKIINKSSLIISLVAFIMGLIAIASIMSVTVMQRRDEFGIMKALGISSKKIVFSIILEGVIIALAAFFTAYIVSNLVLYFIRHIDALQGYVNGEITFTLALYVFLTTIIMSILGSLIPVYTALKVDPVTLIQRGNS
ncbi:ABC transporter permease [Sulfurimonas sp.]|uniref:ABC transporter permease n=1 Tax=Sulfurimonas sp. TaxID=2022749 RepID=UPI003D10F1A4